MASTIIFIALLIFSVVSCGDCRKPGGAISKEQEYHLELEKRLQTLNKPAVKTIIGRNADSLSQYFGEDPARCPFEQVVQILNVFVKTFNKSREENERLAEAEKKRVEKEAMKELSAKKEAAAADERSKANPYNRKLAM
uniref:Uncharacterized protein n=1 Tax=Kalanchoe fedtschenkoi TaxID=63787 RepID=A0A7N0TBG1_KALFE